ncbi:hypothetical protein ACSU1N_05230 [Thermogladius sp. 4427co]|uniref:hypothetical protein n=1 Tax=Thermogladius sp. 4427co TaxID=3450718 RepID=UPI003F7AE9DD
MRTCDICGMKEGRYKCPVCGRFVCEDDFDFEKNMCIACASARCEICGKNLAIGYCRICGRIGCEECLVEESPVSYICIDCARKFGIGIKPRKYRLGV